MPLKSDKKLLKQWNKHYSISDASLADQHAEARNDHAFHAGNRAAYTSSVLDKGRKISVTFNKVKPYIDAVTGFMIQLRRQPDYQARIFDNLEQQELSSYMNSLSDYVRSNANLPSLESRQDREMLITGYGAIDTNVVFETNPDGEVKAEIPQFDDILWDPQAREPNLLDSRWVIRRKKFEREEATKRFRGSKPEEFQGYHREHGNFVYNPFDGEYTKVALGSRGGVEDLVEVFCYQWWDLETYYRAKNPLFDIEDESVVLQLGQLMELMRSKREANSSEDNVEDYFEFDPFEEYLVMTSSIKSDMEAAFRRFGIDVDYQIHEKRVYYTAFITDEKVLLKFRSADQQGFTVKFKTGDYDYRNNRWFGMVAALKDPARYANKALTEMLYVIAANSKGGVMYEEGAVEDPARFEQQWASTKAAIKVEDGALSGAKIQPKAQSSLPNGYENIYGISNDSLGEVTGINKEFLGNSNNSQVSALLESQRVNQVVSTLASYFASIELYQIEHARLMMTYIRQLAENSDGRLIKIIGQDGAIRFDELYSEKVAEEYDISISEAPTTATQKQETTQIMLTLAEKLSLMGINIYDVAVQYLPIKQTDRIKLIEAITPDEPSQEQIEQQTATQELTRQGAMSTIAKNMADAQLKQTQAANTVAKTPVEIVETEADTDNTRANTLKTLAEGEQKHIENDIIKTRPLDDIGLVI